jgi:hypothetical protein
MKSVEIGKDNMAAGLPNGDQLKISLFNSNSLFPYAFAARGRSTG